MALAHGRRRPPMMNYWPSFVDALSTMLLVFIFLLTVFVMAQYFLARDVGGKDEQLRKLNAEIEQLSSLLSLEKSGKAQAQQSLALLTATLQKTRSERNKLREEMMTGASAAAATLEAEKKLSAKARSQVELLNEQIAALRSQLAAVQDALSAQESKNKEEQVRIADLGSRLNIALAQKVQELARYRSDFFGRLREILADQPEFKIVGDRFVLPSEILFQTGQADLTPEGKAQLDKIYAPLAAVAKEIPPQIPWVLRVDGHTDKRPISTPQFKSNWQLSAARAIAVVQYLIGKGFPPNHLLAGAFGPYQPLDTGDTEAAYRRNRRIELKLTNK